MSKKGFLAIWCEMGADDLTDYRAWITKEHIADRTFLPGWNGARFCTNVKNERAHFFLYATADRGVFSAEPYLAVLNNPSPWTRRIMPKFGPFDRALGEQLFKIGNGFGAYMMVSRIKDGSVVDAKQAQAVLQKLTGLPDVVSVRLMKLDRSSTDIKSQEKTMRKGTEGDFHFLLVVEAMSERGGTGAQEALGQVLSAAFPQAQHIDSAVHRMIYGETAFEGQAAADNDS